MRPHEFSSVGAIAALALCLGCGSGSGQYEPKAQKPLPEIRLEPGSEARVFPITEGNQWTYLVQTRDLSPGAPQGTAISELSLRVRRVEKSDGRAIAFVDVLGPTGTVDQTLKWEVNAKGIFQLTAGKNPVPFEPPQPNLTFPPTPGASFSWKGKGLLPDRSVGSSTLEGRVLAPQEVDAESGRYRAIPVETDAKFTVGGKQGRIMAVAYWVPDVGLVRLREEGRLGAQTWVRVMSLKASVLK